MLNSSPMNSPIVQTMKLETSINQKLRKEIVTENKYYPTRLF